MDAVLVKGLGVGAVNEMRGRTSSSTRFKFSPVNLMRGSSSHSLQPSLPPMGEIWNFGHNTCKHISLEDLKFRKHSEEKAMLFDVMCHQEEKVSGIRPRAELQKSRWKSEPAVMRKIKRAAVAEEQKREEFQM